jgi:hypothetical protein
VLQKQIDNSYLRKISYNNSQSALSLLSAEQALFSYPTKKQNPAQTPFFIDSSYR